MSNEHSPGADQTGGAIMAYRRAEPGRYAIRRGVPEPPAVNVGSGPFGIGRDAQDAAHARRLKEIRNAGRETGYWVETGLVVDRNGVELLNEHVAEVEALALSTPPGSMQAMVVDDVAGGYFTRARIRHERAMDTLDAQCMNIVSRR